MNQNRRTTKLTPKQIRKTVIIVAVIAALLTAGIILLKKKVAEEYGKSNGDDILSAQVTTGSISTSVYGSGTLSDDDVEDIEVPDGVELKKIYVSRGDTVNEGDILASVNTNTVLTAMSALSEELDELDDEISEAADESVDSYIYSSVSGRVKKTYAAVQDNVASVMYDNGALMVLSLDGYMAADVDCDKLTAGDSVKVVASNGKKYDGEVSVMTGSVATVLVTDNGPLCDDTVEITDADGNTLGTSTLYIHEQLKIVGYAGTVSYIYAAENSSVYSGSVLIGLTDTSYTANYETLLSQRKEMEQELQELIKIYKEGGIYATVSGTVKTVNAVEGAVSDDTSSSSSSSSSSASFSMGGMSGFGSSSSSVTTSSSSTTEAEQYFSISPDKTMSISLSVDETDILSLSVGQAAVVSVDSISNQTFSGTVTEIDKAGTSSSGVTVYTASVSIEKTSAMLSGMSASATITIDGVDNAIIIPVDALNKTRTGYYVYTSYDEDTDTLGDMVEVTIGISNSSYVEITDGLTTEDTDYYAETEDEDSFSFGGMGGFGGGNMPGGNMPGGGGMPSGGGNMPGGFGGGNMPGGSFPGRD